MNPHLILPEGTQIVTMVEIHDRRGQAIRRKGVVGKIVKSPVDSQHAYLIQFPDGTRASLHRQEIAIRKQLQSVTFDRTDDAMSEINLRQYIIYKCIVGSRAYGLDVAHSDLDLRGIYLPPARLHWSLYGIPEQIEVKETDECYWELQKFLILALKANPNVLEVLYTPLVEQKNEIADALLQNRHRLLSKLVYQTYNGYVLSQFRKLEQDLRTTGALKWKHVMHLVRLLSSGITILKDGVVPVKVGDDRDFFMEIREGKVAWERVNEWRLQLHKEFDDAFETTKLPERPDYDWANSFLTVARKQMVDKGD
jgi:predicted nucleotidyltransferase